MVVIGAGKLGNHAHLPLATRRGRAIANEMRMEHSPDRLRAAVELWARERPNARLRSATAVYNCMGLAFASRRTWIDTDQLPPILQDDGYRRLAGPEEVEVGDTVVYSNGGSVTHVGVVIDISYGLNMTRNITVISQWGADGEYIHAVDHVPNVYGQHKEYWTDRRQKP